MVALSDMMVIIGEPGYHSILVADGCSSIHFDHCEHDKDLILDLWKGSTGAEEENIRGIVLDQVLIQHPTGATSASSYR